MAIICEKEFQISVAQGGLVDYWDFDALPGGFPSKINPTDRTFQQVSGLAGTIILSPSGILNSCMRVQLVSLGPNLSRLYTVATTPQIIISNGFTWTTWVNVSDYGLASETVFFWAIFKDSVGVPILDIRTSFPGAGVGPAFVNVIKNGSTIFTPGAAYGLGVWYLIRVQFDPATLKFGVQRFQNIFGIGPMEETPAIADDLSTIVQGDLSLACQNGGTSPDYRQDESGFWTRLLTTSEFTDLWGGGVPPNPPSYPNIPL